MKTTCHKGRRTHSSYLQNASETTILFLIFVTLTALAFTSCGQKQTTGKPKQASVKMTTATRTTSQFVTLK
jgi:hypothetical protein